MMLEKEQVVQTLRETAQKIHAEQSDDGTAPQSIEDVDSFTLVQMILELEEIYDLRLFEDLEPYRDGEGYRRGEFDALADIIVKIAAKGE